MPTQLGPGFFIGAVIAFVGAILLFIMMGRAGGLAFGFRAWTNLGRFFADEQRKKERRLFLLALAVTGLGSCVLMGSLLVSDAGRNRVCRRACTDAGYEKGRFRANPHVKFVKGAPYECWCYNGRDQWAPRPVPVELPR